MLCYRCGVYNPDSAKECINCGNPLSRNLSGGDEKELIVLKTPDHVSPQDLPLSPHTNIDNRFELIEFFLSGDLSYTYRAFDHKTDKKVLFKIFKERLIQTQKERSSFLKNMEEFKSIRGDRIQRVIDYGIYENFCYVVLEHIEGISLRRIMDVREKEENPFTLDEAIAIINAIALGVDTTLSQAHANLHPGNVILLPERTLINDYFTFWILTRDIFLKIQRLDSKKFSYLSPETKNIGSSPTKKSDLYSLGILLWELLSSQIPQDMYRSISRLNPQIPGAIDITLRRCLDPDPQNRYPALSHFALDLLYIQKTGYLYFRSLKDCENVDARKMIENNQSILWLKEDKPPVEEQNSRVLDEPPPPVTLDSIDRDVTIPEDTQQIKPDVIREERMQKPAQSFANSRKTLVFLLFLIILMIMAVLFVFKSRAQNIFGNPKRCPWNMAFVPGGTYYVGSQKSEDRLFTDRDYQMIQIIDFCMDIYEYPNRDGIKPKNSVSYREAEQYCKNQGKRLCTEDEWEVACNLSQFKEGYQNFCNLSSSDLVSSGSRKECITDIGIRDLVGNLLEWTSSEMPYTEGLLILKGGSFLTRKEQGTCYGRVMFKPDTIRLDTGFRCCKDVK